MRILFFDSGVEMWKVTPSKSETTWSTDTGGALSGVSYAWSGIGFMMKATLRTAP